MDFGIGLNQTLKQEQTLSPQMLQALSLLPMPLLELQAHIQQEIESNPALEIPDSNMELSLGEGPEKNLDDRMDDADSSDYENFSYDPEASDNKLQMLENSGSEGKSLYEHLMSQLGEIALEKTVYEISEMLIGNLDANGFFILPLQQLFEDKDYSQEQINSAISTVQSFDPAGVCVADFRQSLILQAKLSGMAASDLEIFSAMVNQHLEKLKACKFKEVSVSLRISEEDLQTFFTILKSLTPYPGQSFSTDAITTIEPEFSIHQINGKLVLEMNRGTLPNLEISPVFEELAKDMKGPEAKEASSYIKDSINQAKTLITQVNMRLKTMYNAAQAIMEFQSDFFFNGPQFLKTMTLKDIAEKIGVHETTMSRLAQSKWVETDWGLLQLKYFFSQGVSTTSDDSQNISRNAVKDMIAQIISENGNLSDQKISDLLLQKGIKCARRTVGKYRSELNIDSSYQR